MSTQPALHRTRIIACLASLMLLSGCDPRSPDPLGSSQGNARLELPVPLSAIVNEERQTLAADLRLSALNTDFAEPSDVAALPDDRFVVLDRISGHLALYDGNGDLVWTVGHLGDGPGEFRQPVAVAPLGPDRLVVWNSDGRLLVFSSADGAFLFSGHPPVGSDWVSVRYRGPVSPVERPLQFPDEDLTRRLIGTSSGVVVQAHNWTLEAPPGTEHEVAFVTLDTTLAVVDTLSR